MLCSLNPVFGYSNKPLSGWVHHHMARVDPLMCFTLLTLFIALAALGWRESAASARLTVHRLYLLL